MTALGYAAAVALLALLTWRGWQMGALATVTRRLLPLVLLGAPVALLPLNIAAWLKFVLAGVWLVAGGALLWRLRRRRGAAATPAGSRVRRGLSAMNRATGAAMGCVLGALLCLYLALVTAAVAARSTPQAAPPTTADVAVDLPPDPPRPAWVRKLTDFSTAMAEVAHGGVLHHVPYAGEYSGELYATVQILTAEPGDLRRLALRRNFNTLLNVPAIRDAFKDEEYLRLLERSSKADVAALAEFSQHWRTRDILDSQEVGEVAKGLRPTALLTELRAIQRQEPTTAPAEKNGLE